VAVDRKKQIIEAAHKSFSLFGYKATTMDQVAKLANVGKGTIYTFFTNKEELFDEILKDVIGQVRDLASESIRPDEPFIDNLNRFLSSALEFRQQHEFMIRLTHEMNEIGTQAAKEGMLKIEKAILLFIAEHIQIAIDRGELKACDPEITAFAMFKLYVAFVFDWERSHEPLEKEQIAELFGLYLVQGLAVKN